MLDLLCAYIDTGQLPSTHMMVVNTRKSVSSSLRICDLFFGSTTVLDLHCAIIDTAQLPRTHMMVLNTQKSLSSSLIIRDPFFGYAHYQHLGPSQSSCVGERTM